MKARNCVALVLAGFVASTAQAGVTGKCVHKGKPLAFVDGIAAMAPDPFEEKTKVPTIWLTTVALDRAELAKSKPDEIGDAIMEQVFEKDSAKLELRFDAAGKLIEMLQMYVPPGTSRSLSSNEVGKFTAKAPFGTRAAGHFVLPDDDDLKCDLNFDLPMGLKAGAGAAGAHGAVAAAPTWGTALPPGGGDPGATYMAMHKATLAGDIDAMLRLASKKQAAEMQAARKQPEFPAMLEMIKALEPKEVKVVSGRSDGKRAELQIAGKDMDGSPLTGEVKLSFEDGAWHIEKVSTKSKVGK